jgi:hypothetical protein
MILRKEAGITLDEAFERMKEFCETKRQYEGLEKGLMSGFSMDFVDTLMDWLPNFSLATSPGVFGPPIRKEDLFRDGPMSDRDRIMRRDPKT